MATVSQVTVFKIFLLLYLATRGLANIDYANDFTSDSMSLDCDASSINLNMTKSLDSYSLELTPSTSAWCINEQLHKCDHPCRYSIHLQIGELLVA